MNATDMTTTDAADYANRVHALDALNAMVMEALKKATGHPDLTTEDKARFVDMLDDAASDIRFRKGELEETLRDWEAIESYGSVRDRSTGQ